MVKLLTEKQVQDFKTDGFCSPITVMTESEALKLRQSLEAFEQQYPEMLASDQRNNTHLTLPVIDQIAHNSTILDAIEDIIGPDILVFGTVLFIKEPDTKGFVSWHQDGTYMGLKPLDSGVTAWLALSPSNEESGCMSMLPGSGNDGIVDHTDTFEGDNILTRGQKIDIDDDAKAIDLVLRPGQMSLHDRRVIHSSQPNKSNDRRIGIVIQSYLPHNVHQTRGEGFAQWARGAAIPPQFTPLTRPKGEMNPDDVSQRDHVNALWSEILYENSDLKRDL